jgi:hypothetical protein
MLVNDTCLTAGGILNARSTSIRIQAIEPLSDRGDGITNTTARAQRRNLMHKLTRKLIKMAA